jgi:AcrR family transcriptional regulator
MSRWKPDGRRRLQEAALELYEEQGFAAATAAAVAERAGLTERTFFRHFADKKEVLFGDEAPLRDTLVEAVAAAPPEATPFEAAMAGLAALAGVLQSRQDRLMRRARVIAQSTELRERELMKLASWSAALGASLRRRGLGPSAAAFAAETSMATLRVAVRRWIEEVPEKALLDVLHEGFLDLGRFLRQNTSDAASASFTEASDGIAT